MLPHLLTDSLARSVLRYEGNRLYLLFDPMNGLPDTLEDAVKLREARRLRLPGRQDIGPHLFCLLVPARDGYDELMHLTAEVAYPLDGPSGVLPVPGLGGWLIGSHSPDRVAAHLVRVMGNAPPGSAPRYIRLGDPRVLRSLWLDLPAIERDALLGPIAEWWAVDWVGQLSCYRRQTAYGSGMKEIPGTQGAQYVDVSTVLAVDSDRVKAVVLSYKFWPDGKTGVPIQGTVRVTDSD